MFHGWITYIISLKPMVTWAPILRNPTRPSAMTQVRGQTPRAPKPDAWTSSVKILVIYAEIYVYIYTYIYICVCVIVHHLPNFSGKWKSQKCQSLVWDSLSKSYAAICWDSYHESQPSFWWGRSEVVMRIYPDPRFVNIQKCMTWWMATLKTNVLPLAPHVS